MKKVDYIIVGDGYAGLFFAHQLIKHNKSFVLFSEGKKSASQVSAGIINPAVLKKFTTFWKAQEQIDFLKHTLAEMGQYLGINFLIPAPIHRVFHDEKERELWLKKSENEDLKPFLSTDFQTLNHIENPFGTGKVMQSARLDVPTFFETMLNYLDKNQILIKEKFNHAALSPEISTYNNEIQFNKIIFAEGISVKNNPYFSDIEISANKGHHIQIKLLGEQPDDFTIKKKHFLFPLTKGTYYYGGTYDREQTGTEIDETAISQLSNGISEFYKNEFEILEKHNGFRPTVKDRRPLIGSHKEHKNLFVFNGLGARGVLNGCYFAEALYHSIEHNIPLPQEVEVYRFQENNA